MISDAIAGITVGLTVIPQVSHLTLSSFHIVGQDQHIIDCDIKQDCRVANIYFYFFYSQNISCFMFVELFDSKESEATFN